MIDDTFSNGKMIIENNFAFSKFLDYQTPDKKTLNAVDSVSTAFSKHLKKRCQYHNSRYNYSPELRRKISKLPNTK